jgi:polyferredoxin
MTLNQLLAHLIVILHALYLSFVVGGLLLILVGIVRRWQWIRNFCFRLAHLAAIGLVAVEAVFGWMCPLTSWEKHFLEQAGEQSYGGDFVAYWASRLLYWDFPPWVFNILHIAFALLVIAVFVLAPPRWPRRKREKVGE